MLSNSIVHKILVLAQDHSIRNIAQQVNVSKSTVARVIANRQKYLAKQYYIPSRFFLLTQWKVFFWKQVSIESIYNNYKSKKRYKELSYYLLFTVNLI